MSAYDCNNVKDLSLLSTIGYEGKIQNGLFLDQCGQNLIYAIGANVIKGNASVSGGQQFMIGHGNSITCIDADRCGKYIASGQQNFMGFKAEVILWDQSTGCKMAEYDSHLTKVAALKFSNDSKYLMSVGNLDDGSLCVFDTEKCGLIAGGKTTTGLNGVPRTVDSTNCRNDAWVVGGDDYLAVWILNPYTNRLRYEKANLRKIKRDILTIQIDPNDIFAYCGTSTGDCIKLKLNLPSCAEKSGPSADIPVLSCLVTRKPKKCEKGRNNHLYKGGITAMKILLSGDLIIGTGCGTVVQVKVIPACNAASNPTQAFDEYGPSFNTRGKITSILVYEERVYIGTSVNEIHMAKLGSLDDAKMISSAHYSVVNDITFPRGFSQVFASGNYEDVRIWNAQRMTEIVRIHVANMTCQALIFTNDGKCVISGWNDSHVRAHTPQSGTALWLINHAHTRGVSALAITSDDSRLISGGDEGQVRVWSLCSPNIQLTPIAIMKEHKGPVTGLRISCDDTQVASSSGDGSIILWDLEKFVRKVLILQDTLFLDLAFHPSNHQILGVTHNHKLCYFETFDGSSIRELIASECDAVHSVDISPCGGYIVTAGADRQVKLWSYKQGDLLRVGSVHSAEVTRVRFSPCSDYILSTCQDGSIFKWSFPQDLCMTNNLCCNFEGLDLNPCGGVEPKSYKVHLGGGDSC